VTYKSEDNVQSQPAVRHYDKRSINGAFNKFLGIEDADRRILKRFHNTLIEGSEEFAKVFYSYLLSCPATAEILKRSVMKSAVARLPGWYARSCSTSGIS